MPTDPIQFGFIFIDFDKLSAVDFSLFWRIYTLKKIIYRHLVKFYGWGEETEMNAHVNSAMLNQKLGWFPLNNIIHYYYTNTFFFLDLVTIQILFFNPFDDIQCPGN